MICEWELGIRRFRIAVCGFLMGGGGVIGVWRDAAWVRFCRCGGM